jgi:hypothetical protein
MSDRMTDIELPAAKRIPARAKSTDMSCIGLTSVAAMEGG